MSQGGRTKSEVQGQLISNNHSMESEAYFEPWRTATVELFCKKASSYIFDWVLNMPLELMEYFDFQNTQRLKSEKMRLRLRISVVIHA